MKSGLKWGKASLPEKSRSPTQRRLDQGDGSWQERFPVSLSRQLLFLKVFHCCGEDERRYASSSPQPSLRAPETSQRTEPAFPTSFLSLFVSLALMHLPQQTVKNFAKSFCTWGSKLPQEIENYDHRGEFTLSDHLPSACTPEPVYRLFDFLMTSLWK